MFLPSYGALRRPDVNVGGDLPPAAVVAHHASVPAALLGADGGEDDHQRVELGGHVLEQGPAAFSALEGVVPLDHVVEAGVGHVEGAAEADGVAAGDGHVRPLAEEARGAATFLLQCDCLTIVQ